MQVVVMDSAEVMRKLADIEALLQALQQKNERPEIVSAGAKWESAAAFMRSNGMGRRRFARCVETGAVAAKDIGGRGKVYRWAE